MKTKHLPRWIRIMRIMIIDFWLLLFPNGVDSEDDLLEQFKPKKKDTN